MNIGLYKLNCLKEILYLWRTILPAKRQPSPSQPSSSAYSTLCGTGAKAGRRSQKMMRTGKRIPHTKTSSNPWAHSGNSRQKKHGKRPKAPKNTELRELKYFFNEKEHHPKYAFAPPSKPSFTAKELDKKAQDIKNHGISMRLDDSKLPFATIA